MILLETQKEMENMMEDRKLFIDEELISLQLTQIKDDNGIKRELNILITILITTFIKDITGEITLIEKDDITNTVVNEFKCSNKIRYMIIMKIMYWLVKLCRKKDGMGDNNSTSKTNTSTPKTNTSTSKTKDSTSKANTSTPKTNTSTPKTKSNTSTPKTNTSTPKTKTKTNTSTPKTKTKTNTSTPKTKTNTITPKTNTSTPKTNDKVDIENHRSELHKTINNIKTILDCFVCEKFINERFITRNLDKDGISLCSINNSMKGVKIINKISICRDLISLVIEKNIKAMKQDMAISIDDEKVILNTSQTDYCNGIKKN